MKIKKNVCIFYILFKNNNFILNNINNIVLLNSILLVNTYNKLLKKNGEKCF